MLTKRGGRENGNQPPMEPFDGVKKSVANRQGGTGRGQRERGFGSFRRKKKGGGTFLPGEEAFNEKFRKKETFRGL